MGSSSRGGRDRVWNVPRSRSLASLRFRDGDTVVFRKPSTPCDRPWRDPWQETRRDSWNGPHADFGLAIRTRRDGAIHLTDEFAQGGELQTMAQKRIDHRGMVKQGDRLVHPRWRVARFFQSPWNAKDSGHLSGVGCADCGRTGRRLFRATGSRVWSRGDADVDSPLRME